MVMKNSKKLPAKVVKLSENHDFNNLTSLDTSVINSLSKYSVIAITEAGYKNEGCYNSYYYYGYFQINDHLTGAVFAQGICSCCGKDQLILATIDNTGNIVDAIIAAEVTHESECQFIKSAIISATGITMAEKEECGILEGKDQGLTSIDSTTSFYFITENGKIQPERKNSVNLIR